jgi:hypothetical protein
VTAPRVLRFTEQERHAYPDLAALIRDRLPRRARSFIADTTYGNGLVIVFTVDPRPATILTRHASRTARLKPRWQRTTQGATT